MSKDKKLNNLLGMKDFSEKDLVQSRRATKRTDVAKDILNEETGKVVFSEKPKTKDEVKTKELNNLISLDQFSEDEVIKNIKKTKRTDVAKDVLQEKKKECKCKDECECEEKEEKPKGLTAKQKKLPEAMQKAILKRQK